MFKISVVTLDETTRTMAEVWPFVPLKLLQISKHISTLVNMRSGG